MIYQQKGEINEEKNKRTEIKENLKSKMEMCFQGTLDKKMCLPFNNESQRVKLPSP